MKTERILVMVVVVGMVISGVMADDIAPPSWRGQPKTVHAEWDSWTGGVIMSPYYPGRTAIAPDVYEAYLGPDSPQEWQVPAAAKIRTSVWSNNPETNPLGGGIYSEWSPPLHPDPPEPPLGPQPRQGVLAIPLENAADTVIFQLPNYADDLNPGAEKLVRIQITYQWNPLGHPIDHGGVITYYNEVDAWWDVWAYDANPDGIPVLPMSGWNDTLIKPDLIERVFTGTEYQAGWRTDVLEFKIDPNPNWEEFGLKLKRNLSYSTGWTDIGGWVDQVVIDTICPEPTTLVLAALGGTALIRRRREV
ncbi:MAG: PEP-CTERM sorting domain-containing protein [Phycisphaerae bacterium]|nr:PEP-CTERM sorting domain-containing protein [Phycisphaerae bacterium]